MTTGARSTTGKKPKAVRVWGEVSVTVAVTDDPPQYVKATFGHERIAPDDKVATLDRYQDKIDTYNEKQVEKQIKKYRRLIRRVNTGDD